MPKGRLCPLDPSRSGRSAEHACIVKHGRCSEENNTDDSDEGLGEHGSSFLVESNLLIIRTVKNAQKSITPGFSEVIDFE